MEFVVVAVLLSICMVLVFGRFFGWALGLADLRAQQRRTNELLEELVNVRQRRTNKLLEKLAKERDRQ